MGETGRLKIAINAQLVPGVAGGVAQALTGLVGALGQLEDGAEEYLLVVSGTDQMEWLKACVARNQRFVMKSGESQARRSFVLRRALKRRLRTVIRRAWDLVHESENTGAWPQVPISDGFWESLGCNVVHFPFQTFTVCAVPTVFNPHDLQHRHYPQFFTPEAIAWRETIYRAGCDLAHTVVVASQWVKDDVSTQYRISPEKIAIVPWAAPTQAYPEPSPEVCERVRQKYHLPDQFMFYPAATWPHKNHIRLFDALARLRAERQLTLRLVCSGSRYNAFWPVIEKHVADLGIGDQVTFLGFVPDADVRAIYELAQFVVVPSLFESDSFPIYEAWLDGKPVACSNATSLPDQVADAGLVFDPCAVESIADAVYRMATDVELRERLVNRGYRRLKDFDWVRTAKAYRAVYRRAARFALTEEDQWLLGWDWMRDPRAEREASA